MGRPSLENLGAPGSSRGPSPGAAPDEWESERAFGYSIDTPRTPASASAVTTHWTSVSPEVKAKPRNKGQLGRGALKQQLPSNYYLTDVIRANATPSTRASSAVTAASPSVPDTTPPCKTGTRIWRRPPATFRRRHHVGKVHGGATGTDAPAAGESSQTVAGGPRAWSTEPSSDAMLDTGKRAMSALGIQRELVPYAEDEDDLTGHPASARTESRAGPSKFTRFMASQGRPVPESPDVTPRKLPIKEPGGAETADQLAVGPREVSPGSDGAANLKVEEPRLTSRSGYHPEEIERLAKPHQRGASEQTKRRAVSRAYEAFAQQVASAMLPEAQPCERSSASAATYGDRWHTAGEDGYRSALVHAAVRCRELQRSSGLSEQQTALPEVRHGPHGPELVIFNGASAAGQVEGVLHAPELVRLQTACFVFEEMCRVSSPLQDTLRFLFREMCSCIFQGFRPGSDVLVLHPFFVSALQAQREAEEQKKRAEAAEVKVHGLREYIAIMEDDLNSTRSKLDTLREREQADKHVFDTLTDEKNQLRIEVARLQQLSEIRADELREIGRELSHTQGNASDLMRELELSKKSFDAITCVSKEQKNTLERLQGQVTDLQLALRLASDHELRERIPDRPHSMQATPPSKVASRDDSQLPDMPELAQELVLRMHRASPTSGTVSGWAGQQQKAVDHGRLLKIPRHDGGHQVVMRGSVEDGLGNVGVRGSTATGSSPVLIVSGDAFTALSIGLALPIPPDPILFKHGVGNDDDEIIREVYREVQALAEEHSALLDLSRALRRDLKESVKLTKEWNRDELRGVLQNVLCLDSEEVMMVPSPVIGAQALVGLGEEERVPQFLRYDGILKVKSMAKVEVERICQAIWLAKTQKDVEQLSAGTCRSSLADYLADAYVPGIATRRVAQMEHMYNLFLSIRQVTTISSLDAMEKQHQANLIAAAQEGQSAPATPKRRGVGSSAAKKFSGNTNAAMYASTPPGGLGSFGEGSPAGRESRDQPATEASSPTAPHGSLLNVPDLSGRKGTTDRRMSALAGTSTAENEEAPTAAAALFGASVKQLQAQRLKVRLPPDINFNAAAEVLYRSLMSELHEDVHHDQTSMLLALSHAFASLSEHLAPAHWNAPAGVPREIEPAVIGLAEMSAVLRIFFPGKPREYLSEIKRCVMKQIFGNPCESTSVSDSEARSDQKRAIAQSPSRVGNKRTAVRDEPDAQETKPAQQEPPVVDLGVLMGVRMWRGQVVDPDAMLANVIQEPTPFVLELRRQHVMECLMFLDRLQKAFRMVGAGTSGPTSDTGVHLIAVKQAEATLISVDPNLTEDQRRIYILRGFGRRLPDPPSVADEALSKANQPSSSPRNKKERKRAQFEECQVRDAREQAARRAAVMHKTRYLLKDHVSQLIDDGVTVPTDVFIKRLASQGICKGSRMWESDILISEVIKEVGLPLVRSGTASGFLEDLVDNSGPDHRELFDGGRKDAPTSSKLEVEVSRFTNHAVAGKEIQELSAGYPELMLLHWLAFPA